MSCVLSKLIYIIAGELSGDKHAADLMKAVLAKDSSITFKGYGGKEMQAVLDKANAAEPSEKSEQHNLNDWLDKSAVMGIAEVLRQYGWFQKKLQQMLQDLQQNKPDLLILVDYPKFNLTLAEKVRELELPIKIVYYISPKVWAWNKGRVPKMAELLDKMLCIFPFEVPIFEQVKLPTVYVGNPLVDQLGAMGDDNKRNSHLIGLFPGSREREVARLFPVMIEAAILLSTRNDQWEFTASAATPKLADKMQKLLDKNKLPNMPNITIQTGNSQKLMRDCHCGVVASGTATLEAAWLGMPYCLVYKVAFSTYLLGKMIVKIKHIGLINILAQRSVIEEFVQGNCDPCSIERALELFMTNSKHRKQVLTEMQETAKTLGSPGVHHRAATEVLATLTEENKKNRGEK